MRFLSERWRENILSVSAGIPRWPPLEAQDMRSRLLIFLLGVVVGFVLISGFMVVLTLVRGH